MGRGYRWMYHATGLPGWMRGRGWGWGGARGGPAWAYSGDPGYAAGPHWPGPQEAAPPVEDEVTFLKNEAGTLRNYLEGIERRISELEKTSE